MFTASSPIRRFDEEEKKDEKDEKKPPVRILPTNSSKPGPFSSPVKWTRP
jgi:hypothetical protein